LIADFQLPIADLKAAPRVPTIGNRQSAIGNELSGGVT
jgi:hypothetical protein